MQTSVKPGLDVKLIAAQAVAGILAGGVLGFTGMNVGRMLFASAAMGLGDIFAAIMGIVLAYPIGVGLGVWWVGRLFGRQSPWWASILSAFGGCAIIWVIGSVTASGEFYLMWGLFFLLGPVFAIAANAKFARRA